MQYITTYPSPLGQIRLAGDTQGITGLWFVRQKYDALYLDKEHEEKEISILTQAKQWLTVYFLGKEPDFAPPIHLIGSDFQKKVWRILQTIPYGQTITYGEIATIIAKEENRERISAQAVGGAVGHNPIAILVPCHRVIGANGSLTGYAGGLDRKIKLLTLEGVERKE